MPAMVSASPDPTAAASESLMRSSSSISASVMWSVAAAASSLAIEACSQKMSSM